MTPEEIQAMLAQANSQATPSQIANIDAEGKQRVPQTNSQVAVQAQQVEKDAITRGTPSKNITPEEALALAKTLEGVETDDNGNRVVAVVKPDDVPAKEAEIDLTGKTLQEQIAILQAQLEKENVVKTNPLEKVEKQATDAGINISALEQEYLNNGSLTAESLESLKKVGFDEVAIEAYISTKEAQLASRSAQIISDTVGTREEYDKLANWMNTNLTPDAIAIYDKAVSANNGQHAEAYVTSMYAKYTKANPVEVKQTLLRNGAVITTADKSQGFQNQAEMIKAMSDPRYKSDLMYRREVINKTARMR